MDKWVGRCIATAVRAHYRWTLVKQEDLVRVHEAASFPRIGYMFRVHSEWCVTHPDLNYMSQQNLRDEAACPRYRMRRSRRRESRRLPVQPRTPKTVLAIPSQTSATSRDAPIALPRLKTFVKNLLQFSLQILTAPVWNFRKFKIHIDRIVRMTSIISEHISLESSSGTSTVLYLYATDAKLTAKRSQGNKDKRRKQQLDNKLTRSRHRFISFTDSWPYSWPSVI